MSLRDLFSERNFANSVAAYFAAQLMDFGYVVYWHKIDAVQTPDGLYDNYTVDQAAWLADPTFAARLTASKGLVTLTEGETAYPRFPTRPTGTGTVSTADRVQVPTFGVEIGPEVALELYEHGSNLHWRVRSLLIEGRARTYDEMVDFSDQLVRWFDEDAALSIEDHDNLSGEEPDIVRINRRLVTKSVVEDLGEQDRFQVELNARLEFVC